MALLEQPPVPTVAPYWPGNITEPDAPYKRTGNTKKDLLKKYGVRLDVSKKWRKEAGYEETWGRLVDLYRNKQFSSVSTSDRIAVNIAFSTVNVIVPSVAVNHPEITVNARQEAEAPQAEIASAAINYWWRHHDWRREVKRAVKDSLITGNGWVKVGWRYEQSTRPRTPEEHAAEYDQLSAQAGDAAQQNPALAADLPSDQQIARSIPPDVADVDRDEPFVERVSPFDIFIDPEATCLDDLKWIAQRLVLPLEDVKKDPRYLSGARSRLAADASTNVRWRDDKDADKKYSDDVQRCTLWEYYDLRSKFYCVFSEGFKDFLLEPTNFPYPYGNPFVPLGNYEVPDQFYCIGDLEALEPLQHELNAVRTDMMNHRKRWQRAYLAQRDALDPNAQDALLSDEDNRLIFVDGDHDLTNIVVPLPQTQLDPMMYQYSTQIENDVDLISGVSEYQRGSQSEIRRTATEAAMIQDASNARSADKLAQIEDFMSEIAERVLQLAQQFLTGEHVARIVGPDGAATWVPFDKERITGEFDFEVEAGSTQPRNETYRRQQALQLANVLQPYVSLGAVNPQAIVSYILKEGFGVKTIDQFLQVQQQSGPSEKLIETIAYKDTPPDIQRQMEQQAGFQPSTMTGATVEGAPPANQQNVAPQTPTPPDGAAPTDNPQQALSLPQSGPSAIPPEVLTQLQGQVGLNVPNAA